MADIGQEPAGATYAKPALTVDGVALQRHSDRPDAAAQAGWFPLGDLPPLAFDHGQIVAQVLKNLKS